MTRIRRLALLATAAAGLSACGAGGNPVREVVAAADKTLTLSGTSYDLALTGERLVAPPVAVPGGRAAYDFTTGVGYEALTVEGRGRGTRTLYLDYLPDSVSAAPWPTPAGLLPPGKIWLSIPLAGPAAGAAAGPLAMQLEGLAPELALDEIAWGTRAATYVGVNDVRRVPMNEYRVTVDLPKALTRAGRSARGAVAAGIASELQAIPSKTLTLTVWITGPGHVGRIDETVPGSKLGTVSFEFSSFDAQFKRNPLRPSQSVRLRSITQGAGFAWEIFTGI